MSAYLYFVDQIILPLAQMKSANDEQSLLLQKTAQLCGVPATAIREITLQRRSLDARHKERPAFVYTVIARLDRPAGSRRVLAWQKPLPFTVPQAAASQRVIVTGAGPAGLFAALTLARAGLFPLVVERGKPVAPRRADVDLFWTEGRLDENSNIQFGEGGAGAFSDGKLTSRSKDPLTVEVLRTFIACGADPSISWQHKPHLGSDLLPNIITRLRAMIEKLGGKFIYETQLSDLHIIKGTLDYVTLTDRTGRKQELETDLLLLAGGNGARELYRLLAKRGIALAAKPFAVGLRIEQAQKTIDRAQYGSFAGHPLLSAADYALTWRDNVHSRGCFTFCNCPGGYVINAASNDKGIAVNGVSLAARDAAHANAAVVAQVSPGRDFGTDELDGMEYQQKLEHNAFILGGGDMAVPVMSATAFLGDAADCAAAETSTMRSARLREADLTVLLGEEITAGLQGALRHWEKQLPGFTHNAVLSGVESRTSAPLTILRGRDRQSLNCQGLYPCGEGAGYAGGIMSSAIDGINSALALIENNK